MKLIEMPGHQGEENLLHRNAGLWDDALQRHLTGKQLAGSICRKEYNRESSRNFYGC